MSIDLIDLNVLAFQAARDASVEDWTPAPTFPRKEMADDQTTPSKVDRVKTVQAVVDRMLPVGLAAQRLGLSRRQLERHILKYRTQGAAGLVSVKRGRPSEHQLGNR